MYPKFFVSLYGLSDLIRCEHVVFGLEVLFVVLLHIRIRAVPLPALAAHQLVLFLLQVLPLRVESRWEVEKFTDQGGLQEGLLKGAAKT